MFRRILGPVVASLAIAATATAATDTDTLTVTATVQSGCALTGGTLNFGNYVSSQGPDLDAVGQISYASCNGQLRFELDGGTGGSVANRQMSSGSNKLRYQIYRNSTRTSIWGTGTDAYATQLLQTQSGRIDVFGRIPGGQAVAPGTYSDTINITLTF